MSSQSKAIRNRIKTIKAFRLTAGFCLKYFLNYNLFNFLQLKGFLLLLLLVSRENPLLVFLIRRFCVSGFAELKNMVAVALKSSSSYFLLF